MVISLAKLGAVMAVSYVMFYNYMTVMETHVMSIFHSLL